MKDLLTNLLLAGFGAAVLTKEKAEDIMGELISKGEMSKDEAKAYVDSLVEKGKSEQNSIIGMVRDEVRKVIEDMGVPSKHEIDELKKKVAELEAKLSEQK
ncbi:MAG: phasin family protein [Candidatus Xenobiia bacterium LiM19]